MGQASTAAKSPRKRRKGGETRTLLINACIDLIRSEGLMALSTERVTRAAHISQPGFYNHFKNTDELLRVSVVSVLQDMAGRQTVLRREMMGGLETPQDAVDAQTTRNILEAMLDVFLSEPVFAELFLRYRFDASLLDGAVMAVAQEVIEDNISDLWELSRRMGARQEDYPRVALHAEHLSGIYYRTAELMLAKRYSRELILQSACEAVISLTRGLQEVLLAAQMEPPR